MVKGLIHVKCRKSNASGNNQFFKLMRRGQTVGHLNDRLFTFGSL